MLEPGPAVQRLIDSDLEMLKPEDIAPVLGVHQQQISDDAKNGTLPFPFYRSGNRTKIPRIGFLKWGRWID